MKHLHPKAAWLFFLRKFGTLSLLVLLIFGAPFLLLNFVDPQFFYYTALPYIIVVSLLVLIYIWSVLEYRFYKYALTEDAFKKELGVINKKYVTIPYDRIQNIDIYRGILHRILGLSDLHIQTAGGESMANPYTKYSVFSEANLPGLSYQDAELLRDELLNRMKLSKSKFRQ